MALDANVVQPNAVVDFNGHNVTVVSVQNDVATLGNHEDGTVTQFYLSYLLEHGNPISETLAEENAEVEPTNATGYDPVTGKPNPPSSTTPTNPNAGPSASELSQFGSGRSNPSTGA